MTNFTIVKAEMREVRSFDDAAKLYIRLDDCGAVFDIVVGFRDGRVVVSFPRFLTLPQALYQAIKHTAIDGWNNNKVWRIE